MMEPKDIFSKYTEKWCDNTLAISKWKEKCDAMDLLIADLAYPKLVNSKYNQIITLIQRCLNDSNANVLLSSLKISGLMAKGLRK